MTRSRAVRLSAVVAVSLAVAALATLGVVTLRSAIYQNTTAPPTTIKADKTTTMQQTTISTVDPAPPSRASLRLESANKWYLVMVALTSLCGAGSLVASFGIYRFSGQVSSEQGRLVASLQSSLAQANARIGEAAATAAMANEKAAVATFNAQSVKLATDWRTVPSTVVDALVLNLKQHASNKVHIAWVLGDPEATYYAAQMTAIFVKAGWTVTEQTYPVGIVSFGISIPDTKNAGTQYVRDAFSDAKVEFGTYIVTPLGMYFGTAPEGEEAVITICSKAPADISSLLELKSTP